MKLFVSFCLFLLAIEFSSGQSARDILSRFQDRDLQLPIIGACDRIAARGVANCMQNFLPTSLLSNIFTASEQRTGTCCSFRKYSACITGLNDGLRIAMERAKCPKSYSTQIITSLGNGITVRPVAALCESFRGSCGKRKNGNSTKKPKRNSTPSASDSVLKPVQDLFGGFPSILSNRDSIPSASESVLKPAQDLFGGFSSILSNRDTKPSASESVLKPAQDLFGGFSSILSNRDSKPSSSDSVLKPAQDLFGGFPSIL